MRHFNFSRITTPHRALVRAGTTGWRIGQWGVVVSCLLSAIAPPARAADRVYVTYGVLERSIKVQALEEYVKTGKMDEDLAVYAHYAGDKGMEQVRNVLKAKAELKPIAISQFLNSFQGEEVLKRVGQVIQPNVRVFACDSLQEPIKQRIMKCKERSRVVEFSSNGKLKQQAELRDSGSYIRAAISSALSDKKDGLTVLNFLKQYPSDGLRLNVQRGLDIVSTLERLVTQTKQASAAIVQQANRERDMESVTLPRTRENLRNPGPFVPQKQTIKLVDPSRRDGGVSGSAIVAADLSSPGRHISVDIYLPERGAVQPPRKSPVVIISHGLASDRTAFVYLARHLASYGFAVLVPQHPGSDAKQLEGLFRGSATEVSEPEEFINRPKDITFLLDEVERQAKDNPSLQGRMNLQEVGVLGQSFGGYTSLALAGATITTAKLQQICRNLDNDFNLSLLLQCRAESILPGQLQTGLRDRRIKAVIALNPFTSAVFGQAGMSQVQVPTMILSGNADTIAPALSEQIQPFTWLTTSERYLVMLDGGTHFSLLSGADRLGAYLPIPDEVLGPNTGIARRYLNALAVAFFKTYLFNQSAYRSYLSATYASQISESSLPLHLVRMLTADQLPSGTTAQTAVRNP